MKARLRDLLAGTTSTHSCELNHDITGVASNLAQVKAGSVFFKCRFGNPSSSATAALAHGASHAVILAGDSEEPALLASEACYSVVPDVDRAFAVACSRFFGRADERLTIIGVTGTKGKTTVCHLVNSALRDAGIRSLLVSSLTIDAGSRSRAAFCTTPDPLTLHSALAFAVREGCTHAVIELSSIGIAEERVYGVVFDVLVLTNIGQDHFEYHGGRENYIAAKLRVFNDSSYSSAETARVINLDDAFGRELAHTGGRRFITYGLRDDADVFAASWLSSSDGTEVQIGEERICIPLFGVHNVSNLLAAAAVLEGLPQAVPVRHLAAANLLSGRLQRVPFEAPVRVYIDAAHTPESVEAALDAIRLVEGDARLVVIVGCSGNSDRGKRPHIARVAASKSDLCILSSDNPNMEHPAAIVRDMLTGLSAEAEGSRRVRVVLDRAMAIDEAVVAAGEGGVVAVLGKGAETSQLVYGRRVPHSDLAVSLAALQRLSRQTT